MKKSNSNLYKTAAYLNVPDPEPPDTVPVPAGFVALVLDQERALRLLTACREAQNKYLAGSYDSLHDNSMAIQALSEILEKK